MSKKLSELPLSRQFADDGTILISSANNGTKRIDIATFLELIGGGISSQELSELTDVYINEPIDGQVLKYDGHFGKWTNGTGGGGTSNVQNLTDLQDVAIANPNEGCILQYNASTQKWENKTFKKIYTNIEDIPNWGVVAYNTNEAFIEIGGASQTISFTGEIGDNEFFYQRLFDDELTSSQLEDLRDDLSSISPYPGRIYLLNGLICVKINGEYQVIRDPSVEWTDYSPNDYYIKIPTQSFNGQDPNNLYISAKPMKVDIGSKSEEKVFTIMGWTPLALYQLFITAFYIAIMQSNKEPENLLDFTNFGSPTDSNKKTTIIVP